MGRDFATLNIHYFGYLAYINLPILVLPIYSLYKNPIPNFRFLELLIASLLLASTLLIAQALLIEGKYAGEFGLAVTFTTIPTIGIAGTWLIALASFCISLVIMFDVSFQNLVDFGNKILRFLKEKLRFKIDLSFLKKWGAAIQSRAIHFLAYLKTLRPKPKPKATPKPEEQAAPRQAETPTEVRTEENYKEMHIPHTNFHFDESEETKEFRTIEEERFEIVNEIHNQEVPENEDYLASKIRLIKATNAPQVQKSEEATVQKIEVAPTPAPTPTPQPIMEQIAEQLADQVVQRIKESMQEPQRILQAAPEHSQPIPYAQPATIQNAEPTQPPRDEIKAEIKEEPKIEPQKIEIIKEIKENQALLRDIELGKSTKPNDFQLPPTSFLQEPKDAKIEIDEAEIDQKIADLLDKLKRFKIEGDVVGIYAGPIVTTFEFKPAPNVKVSKILTLEDDLAMALKAKTIRIQAPVPGKDVVGIEIPNNKIQTIYLREVLESEIFQKSLSPLTIVLGKDIVGNPFVTDLKKLPHLLIAGTTGSGKSVGINAMILSLLYKNSPDNLKLMMIDPKMLEFSIYNDIPHLLTPVITQPKKAVVALNNVVSEMERRNNLMAKAKTKNIEGYNQKAALEGFEPFPYIVVIIDELSDLMMTSGKDVEYSIARLAQMARASGIHLIVATQRPSVDVVTGLIKANLPSRISYKVGQKIDSKVILDSFGAESLLGKGDMLFTPPNVPGLVRLHAPWSTEEEIENIVEFLKSQREVRYSKEFLDEDIGGLVKGENGEIELDEMYEMAKEIVLTERKASISNIQRRLQVGYNRAARMVEQLEAMGILSEADHKGNREILI